MPKHLIRSNIPKDSFDDPSCGAHHRFNLCSNLTNYDFLETSTCLQDTPKILDQNSFICIVFKTQTFYCARKMLFWEIWPLGKELGITLSIQIEMDWFLILNASIQNSIQIWANKIIFHLLKMTLKIAQNFRQIGVWASISILCRRGIDNISNCIEFNMHWSNIF